MAERSPSTEADLSSKELAALERFGKLVEELPNVPEKNDRYYLRWLRARKFDVSKSISMLKKVNEPFLPDIHCILVQKVTCGL